MRIRVWILSAVFFSPAIWAEEKCEHAVDQADSLNVNLKECDGEKTGLNAAIHNYFNREAGSKSSSSSSEGGIHPENQQSLDKPREMLSGVISSAEALTNERYQLIQRILKECPKGVDLSKEFIIPEENGFKIKLIFDCI